MKSLKSLVRMDYGGSKSRSRSRPKTANPRRSIENGFNGLRGYSGLSPLSAARQTTIDRLATPRNFDTRWLPDKPSVYWLDYIIDPTPHKIRDPKELASYYDNLKPRFPRTSELSTPKVPRDDLDKKEPTKHGISRSALSYRPSERIRDLARPKTVAPISTSRIRTGVIMEEIKKFESISKSSAPSTTRQSSAPSRLTSATKRNDFARGDFRRNIMDQVYSPVTKSKLISPKSARNEQSANKMEQPLQMRTGRSKPRTRGPFSVRL